MNKKIKLLLILLIIFMLIFFMQKVYKTIKIGNNINKSTESVIEYILNISSYEAEIEVTVNSNKNTNQYEIKQQYTSQNVSKQIINKPDYINGLVMKYDGDSLTIENTNLSITKVYEKYQYLNNNCLWLNNFIEDYKFSENIIATENDDEVILEVNNLNNIYNYKKKLYINKKTIKPSKLEVIDNNKKTRIYIIYKEIELNSTNKDEILAFKLEKNKIEL